MAVVHSPIQSRTFTDGQIGCVDELWFRQAASFVVAYSRLGDSWSSAQHTGCVLAVRHRFVFRSRGT